MPQRKFYRKIYRKTDKEKVFDIRSPRKIIRTLSFVFLFFIFLSLVLFIYYAKDLPRPEKFTEKYFIQSTKIYDRTGEIVLWEMYEEEKRTLVSLGQIPEHLKQAIIATEDADFYGHFGIDPKGVIRSVLINFKLMKATYGGSTIPQQLIRSTFFSIEKTAERKIREVILALELDRRYSKDQILEWYLNQVPFGSNTYGVEAASQTYFQKSVSEISLSEAAILASLIKAPSYLSPYGFHVDELFIRKNYVLDRMVKERYISQEEANTAKEKEIEFSKFAQSIKAPHFVLYVRDYLIEKYGEEYLKEKGLRVYTSLDWELQEWAEKTIEERVKINKNFNSHNAATIAIDPKTGEILVMVGSADWFGDSYPEGCTSGVDCQFDPKFNAVVGTKQNPGRQPGSAFKPFIYVTAFKNGYSDQEIVIDEETNFGVWGDEEYIPKNYDDKFRGEVTLREALAQSLNVPSVKVLLYLARLEDSIETAETLGISTLKPPYGPAIVLGGWEVKLIDMVSAYGVFATEGLKLPPLAILKIEDAQGNIIEENKKTPRRVLEKEPIRLLNDILSDNEARAPMFGFNSNLYFPNYQIAAKTGTTQDYRDAWAVGYSPSIVVGVWVGNNDNSSMSKKPSVSLAGPIFHAIMEKGLTKYPKEDFIKPEVNQSL